MLPPPACLLAAALVGCGSVSAPTPAERSPAAVGSAALSSAPPVPSSSATASAAAAPVATPRYARGTVAWARSPADQLTEIAIASAGADGAWLVGNNQSNFSLPEDMVVERVAADGTSRWQSWGTARWGRAVAASGDHAWVLSEFGGQLRFTGQALSADQRTDIGLLRLRTDGRADLARSIATPDFDRADGIAAMPDGGVVILHGAFAAPTKGPLVFTMVGSRDTLVTRIGPEGEILWTRNLGVAGYDEATAIVTDPKGEVFVGGTQWDSADANLYTKNDAAHRPFVVRLGPSGEIAWRRELRKRERARLSGLVALSDGRLVVAETEPSRGASVSPTTVGATSVTRLDANGEASGERVSSDVECLVAGEGDATLVVSRRGIAQLDDGHRQLLELDKEQILDVDDCARGPGHSLFLAGQVKPGGRVGAVAVTAPHKVRAPKWMSSYEVAFVARIDLVE